MKGGSILPIVEHPRLVICVPLFNEGRFLRDTLNSVLLQTSGDFAVFLSDNASTDESGAICGEFADRDKRFVYFRHETNIGATQNFNFTWQRSNSEFLMWLGAHDILAPDFVECLLPKLESDPDAALVFSHPSTIDEMGNVLNAGFQRGMLSAPQSDIAELRSRASLTGKSPIVRSLRMLRAIEWCSEFNHPMRRRLMGTQPLTAKSGNDYVFLTRLAHEGTIKCVDKVLYFRRFITKPAQTQSERLTGAHASLSQETIQQDLRAFYQGTSHNAIKRRLASYVSDAIIFHRFGIGLPNALSRIYRHAARVVSYLGRLRDPRPAR